MAGFRNIRRLIEHRPGRHFVVFLMLVTGFSISIVYTNVQTFDPVQASASGYSDTVDYINMFRGRTGQAVGIRAYRPLVPALARLLPDPPGYLFNGRRVTAPESDLAKTRLIALKFGLVNLAFLIGSCVALFVLLRDFGHSDVESYLGVLFFLSSQTVVRSAGLPMTDTAFYFFFLICLVGLIRGHFWTVLVATTVGVLSKELVLLAAPLALLTIHNRSKRWRLFVATLPAVLLYVVVRITLKPPADAHPIAVLQLRAQLGALLSPNGILNLAMAFGLVWIPAVYGAAVGRPPTKVRRWSWLVPLVVTGVLFGGGNLGRGTFSAFPIIIPLALTGIFTWVGHGSAPTQSDTGAPSGNPGE